MNYWNMQLHPNDMNWGREKELLENHKLIGLGDWEEETNQQEQFESTMSEGDIVLIRRGQSIIALVKVIGKYVYSNEPEELIWFERRRKVEILDWYKDEYELNVSARKTLEKCASKDTDTYKSILKWIEIIKGEHMKEEIKELLLTNKNLILTGAPGTGKSHLANEIAEEITNTKKGDDKGQIGFVQFHPSYDYTDFVEGLQPTKPDANGNIGFELRNGIFKEFCKRALATLKSSIDDYDSRDPSKGTPVTKEELEEVPKYVFIIDEINRGEISKIFGELFFSIDPDYRGKKGKIKTQYANMADDGTAFSNENDDYFYIPKNVYIIGTMNDIDRSVDSFDFAMRRRFAWKEIKANDSHVILDSELVYEVKKTKNKMDALNNAIWNDETQEGIEGLSSSYHIGGAYFLKLNDYNNDKEPFTKLWDYHLKGLLYEYLRGLPNIDENMKNLKDAYNNT